MKSSAVIVYIVVSNNVVAIECLAINIFRNSDRKSTETSQNSDQKLIETSQNSDQKRIFYAEMLTCLHPRGGRLGRHYHGSR